MADCEEIQAGHVQRKGQQGDERSWVNVHSNTLYGRSTAAISVTITAYGHSTPLFYLGLCFGFLQLRRLPNKLLSYTKQLFFCLFAADAILKGRTKGRTPCLHLHALCGDLGTRKCEHPCPDFLESQFIHRRMLALFVFRNNVSSFSHWGSKTFCLFPANLATRKHNKKQCFRNNVKLIQALRFKFR